MAKSPLILLLLLLFAPVFSAAKEIPLPAKLTPAIDHLLAQVGPAPAGAFDPAKIDTLIDFVLSAEEGPLYFEADPRDKTTSASHAFSIDSDLAHLLRYRFDPAIPSHLLNPSSVRIAHWTEIDGGRQALSSLVKHLPGLDRPVLVRGIEREEITPNLATGTYFKYDVHRTVILLPHREGSVLITLSRQSDRSQVGHKGAVLGADTDWDYLYSGEKGVARPGLGWVNSYMYESFSIGIFCRTFTDRPRLKSANFKWLNAGWSGINMVKRAHIHEGLVRYARDLRQLLEHPNLPAPEALARTGACLSALPDSELQSKFRLYAERLNRSYAQGKELSSDFSSLLRSGAYPGIVSREEMEAALSLELMKCRLFDRCADRYLSACRN